MAYKLGWRPLPPDFRHHQFADLNVIRAQAALPTHVDLCPLCPPVYDQGELGSCTAQASAALFAMTLKVMQTPQYTPSRLFIYYNERAMEGTLDQGDVGSSLTTGMKILARLGGPRESLWWYNTKKYNVKPNRAVYNAGLADRIQSYQILDNSTPDQLRTCLADGYPFVFGFSVYESFTDIGADGVMPMPARREEQLGGHAVIAVGYDDARQAVLVRNSWGTGWGYGGYFWMPYQFITDRSSCDEFWTARMINFLLSGQAEGSTRDG